MSYENYRLWLRGLVNKELNEELKKLRTKVDKAPTGKARQAWKVMLTTATQEQQRRDGAL